MRYVPRIPRAVRSSASLWVNFVSFYFIVSFFFFILLVIFGFGFGPKFKMDLTNFEGVLSCSLFVQNLHSSH